MSRVGKLAVPVPKGVTAAIDGQEVKVKGPKGELSFTVPDQVEVKMTDAGIKVDPRNDTQEARALRRRPLYSMSMRPSCGSRVSSIRMLALSLSRAMTLLACSGGSAGA